MHILPTPSFNAWLTWRLAAISRRPALMSNILDRNLLTTCLRGILLAYIFPRAVNSSMMHVLLYYVLGTHDPANQPAT